MLSRTQIFRIPVLLIATAAIFFSLSADPRYKVPPYIKSIGIIILDFHSYYLTAGGVDEYSASLTERDTSQLWRSVTSELKTFGYAVTMLSCDTADTVLSAVEALYKTVRAEIEYHVYGDAPFDSVISGFDYTLGPIEDYCEKFGVDAFLFVSGFDETKTKLRRDVEKEALAASIAGAVVGSIIGFGGGGVRLRDAYTCVNAGLVSKNGSLCWYKKVMDSGEININESQDANTTANHLFESWPVERKKK
jgi:hypothetical protein